tara:strand:+ start:111 stop:332 length:222 start_codon:yes stop_codon:yes gene_type:complete
MTVAEEAGLEECLVVVEAEAVAMLLVQLVTRRPKLLETGRRLIKARGQITTGGTRGPVKWLEEGFLASPRRID